MRKNALVPLFLDDSILVAGWKNPTEISLYYVMKANLRNMVGAEIETRNPQQLCTQGLQALIAPTKISLRLDGEK